MFRKQVLSAALYPAIVFPLAIVWHLMLFPDAYRAFGYFEGEPDIAIGLASMIVQGVILAAIYPMFRPAQTGFARAFTFSGMLGVFFWTCHVLGLVAKHDVPRAGAFILMESIYLGLQFGLFAIVLCAVFRTDARSAPAPTQQ